VTVCLAKGEEGKERRPENVGVEVVLSLLGDTPLPDPVVNPYRPGRVEPRNKNRQAKNHSSLSASGKPVAPGTLTEWLLASNK
jgi:hypothetical protein